MDHRRDQSPHRQPTDGPQVCIPRRSDSQYEPGHIPPAGQGPSQQGLRHHLLHLRQKGGANVAGPVETHAWRDCGLGGEDSD